MPKTKKSTFWKKSQNKFIFGMLSVSLINFVVFWLYVNFSSIAMAFQSPSSDGFTLVNFSNLFKEFTYSDSLIPMALTNTMKYFSVGLFIMFPLSLLFSYFLYKKVFMYKIFRIVFFLPSIISVVVLASLYENMVAPKGIITKLIMKIFQLKDIPILLGETRYALNTVICYNIWTGFGVNIILFGGAMARIPEDIIEYDRLEGVGFFREMVRIVMPLIWPTISTVLTLSVVGIFNSSGPILFLTPSREDTYSIAYWIFKQVYEPNGVLNYAAAVGIFFTIIGLPLVLLVKWGLGKIGSDIEY